MNEPTIEKLLQKAPPMRTPSGLLKELQANIELPRMTATNHESRITNHAALRRWLPAFGFALWFLGCIVVFGIQASRIAELKHANESIRNSVVSTAPSQIDQNQAGALTQELEQLRKDATDAQRLRAEADLLRAQVQELTSLREQNQQLRAELKSQAAPPVKPEDDFFSVRQGLAGRLKCVNNLKQVGLAARLWANDSKTDTLPDAATLIASFAKRQLDAKIMFCAADGTTPYEILSPGASENDPQVVYTRCPIHGTVGLVDGSVQQLSPPRVVELKDGKWIIK